MKHTGPPRAPPRRRSCSQTTKIIRKLRPDLVEDEGIEPATSCMRSKRSTPELDPPHDVRMSPCMGE